MLPIGSVASSENSLHHQTTLRLPENRIFADEQQFAIDSHSMASKIITHMKRVSAYLNRRLGHQPLFAIIDSREQWTVFSLCVIWQHYI